MATDFVREMIALLEQTPRTAWDVTVRMRYGGESRYIARRDPLPTETVRQWVQMGVSARTARMKIRGK